MDNFFRGVPAIDNVTVIDNRNVDYFFRGNVALAQPLVNTNPVPPTPTGTYDDCYLAGKPIWKNVNEFDNRGANNFLAGKPIIAKCIPMSYISGTVLLDNEPIAGAQLVCTVTNGAGVVGTTYSDINGYYTFQVLADKQYDVTASYEVNGQKYRALTQWSITPKEVS